MFSLRPVLKSLGLLVFFVTLLSVFAQQEEESDNSSLMTNYNALREEGQGFFILETSTLFEKPDSVISFSDSLTLVKKSHGGIRLLHSTPKVLVSLLK